MEQEAYRHVPYDIDVEQALLGAILADNRAMERASALVKAEHFYDPLHGRIFETMVQMIERGGVVVTQEYHPAYGNMIEVDHGNQLVTRYAHASRTLVKVGDIVRRGQKIAEVGTTGRSTGPHLHFEVLVQGVFQDPQKFLSAGGTAPGKDTGAQVAALQPRAPPGPASSPAAGR